MRVVAMVAIALVCGAVVAHAYQGYPFDLHGEDDRQAADQASLADRFRPPSHAQRHGAQRIHLHAQQLHVREEHVRELHAFLALDEASRQDAARLMMLAKSDDKDLAHHGMHLVRSDGVDQFLVLLKAPVTPRIVERVNDAIQPCRLGDYVPNNAFHLVCDAQTVQSVVAAAPHVVYVMRLHDTFKFHPKLPEQLAPERDSQHVTLVVHLAPTQHLPDKLLHGAPREDEDALADLLATLPTFVAQHVTGRVVLPARLHLEVSSQVAREALFAVVAHRRTRWVHKHTKPRIMNRFARYLVQSRTSNVTSIWDRGLHGEGNVIALSDTGLDVNSCFFRDSSVEAPFDAFSPSHRKIATYVAKTGNRVDTLRGHGTHTAGSVVGKSSDTNSEYNGMAYEARIAFYDVQKAGGEQLDLPDDLSRDIFGHSYREAGARIASNSWGSDDNTYSSLSYDTDLFAFNNQDYLLVFAAGNDGDSGLFTVAEPALAKNVLAVGASKSTTESFLGNAPFNSVRITAPASLSGQTVHVAPAEFGSQLKQNLFNDVRLALASPFDACGPLAGDLAGKAVLITRGTCPFTEKAKRAQDAGAVFVLIMDSAPSADLIRMGPADPSIIIPCVSISYASGTLLKDNVAGVTLSGAETTPDPNNNENRIASFSSRGPTVDGRIKPDVLAPGQPIMSAMSNPDVSQSCSVVQMEGTSMACPIAAGAAALTRQYFMEGWYPSGNKTLADSFAPASALLKAMLINSGLSVTGTVLDDYGERFSISKPPSVIQGYGRVVLEDTLRFTDSAHSLWVDRNASVALDDVKMECFRVRSFATPFKVTLVWTDPPVSVSSKVALVSNLDLSLVHAKSNTVLLGNELSFTDSSDKVHRVWDMVNNVEQIVASNQTGEWLVSVLGTNLPAGNQSYSLVVTGDFEKLPLSSCDTQVLCPANCGDAGKCVTGRCQCDTLRTGADCSVGSRALNVSDEQHGNLGTYGWDYYHLELTAEQIAAQPSNHSLRIKLSRTTRRGDPDVYVSFNEFPTNVHFEYANTDNDERIAQQGRNDPLAGAVLIPVADLQAGRYQIGVYGYCCSPTGYLLQTSIGYYAASSESYDSFVLRLVLAIVGTIIGAAFLLLAVITCRRCIAKRREQRPAFADAHLAHIGHNVPMERLA